MHVSITSPGSGSSKQKADQNGAKIDMPIGRATISRPKPLGHLSMLGPLSAG